MLLRVSEKPNWKNEAPNVDFHSSVCRVATAQDVVALGFAALMLIDVPLIVHHLAFSLRQLSVGNRLESSASNMTDVIVRLFGTVNVNELPI